MMKFYTDAVLGLALAGCASKSTEISATYVSPSKFGDMSCAEIEIEAMSLSEALSAASIAQDQQASSDVGAAAIATILFWPALFMIDGDDETASNLAKIKGEMQAIEQASDAKSCDIAFGPATEPTE